MRRSTPIAMLFATLGMASCRTSSGPDRVVVEDPHDSARLVNFQDRDSQIQRVKLDGARRVILECYCRRRKIAIIRPLAGEPMTLRIDGLYNINGYHGTREDAGARPIPPEALHFTRTDEDGVIRMRSTEWRFMHHKLVVESLRVEVPSGVMVQFALLTDEALGERRP
jgi:hypothetical protein